tara:strand:+ start:54 stop:572 length:519 start_codon:yes stop_codon:yes gene_type:complete
MKAKNLKLIAKTSDDLRVVSAYLQDSIASISNFANLKKNKIFLMQLNRFMWEDVENGVFRKNKRIRTILKFENVLKVHSKILECTFKTFSNFKIVLILLFFLNTPFSTSSHINLFNCIRKILFFFKLAKLEILAIESCKYAETTLKSSDVLAINFKFLAFILSSINFCFTFF